MTAPGCHERQGRRRAAPRRGFSLVEVLAVLAVLAVITGLAAWGLRRSAAGGGTGAAVWAAMAAADQRARARAEASGQPARVRVDLTRQRLAWFDPADPGIASASTPALTAQPARGWTLEACWTAAGGWVARGVIELPLNRAGATPAFGLRLTRGNQGPGQRVLVVGETGQWVPAPAAAWLPAEGDRDETATALR